VAYLSYSFSSLNATSKGVILLKVASLYGYCPKNMGAFVENDRNMLVPHEKGVFLLLLFIFDYFSVAPFYCIRYATRKGVLSRRIPEYILIVSIFVRIVI
jgi:hypothetical protein